MNLIYILIIEDSESKLQSIQRVVERTVPKAKISVAQSVRSAIDAIGTEQPTLIIADMSLPTYDIKARERGGSPRPFGGVDIFDYLDKEDFEIPILVVTSYPVITDGSQTLGLNDLAQKLAEDYPENFIDTVYFDSEFSVWENKIEAILTKYLREWK
ncbi:MAG: response regulator [Pseudohongiella sp.]|nr:response regulator [Pseudohongiella sp.]